MIGGGKSLKWTGLDCLGVNYGVVGLDWRHFRNTPSAVSRYSYVPMSVLHVDFSHLVVLYLI